MNLNVWGKNGSEPQEVNTGFMFGIEMNGT